MADNSAVLREYLVKILGEVEGIKEAVEGLKQVDEQTKKVTKSTKQHGVAVKNLGQSTKATIRQFARAVIGYKALAQVVMSAGRKLNTLIKKSIEWNDTLEETAKKLGKTTEQARAHQIALDVMGKTMDEINRDDTLKKTYDDLVKLGESLALPDAAKGMTAIKNLKNSLGGLRVTLRYGIQWVYYYLQKYLATPFNRLRKWLEDSGASDKIKKIAKDVAKILADLYLIIERLVKDVKHIWDGLKKVWNSFDGRGKAILAAVVAGLTLILNKGLLVKGLILGLIVALDDFFTWLEGGESVLGDLWYKVIAFFIGVRNGIASVVNSILDAINAISSSWVAELAGIKPANIEWRMGMYDTDAILDYVAKARAENAANFKAQNDAANAAYSAGAAQSAEGNAALAQGTGAAYYDSASNVDSHDVTTNTYNFNTTINAQNAEGGASDWEREMNNAQRNVAASVG